MSVAAASADPAPPKRGRKKLWIIAAIVVLIGLLLAGGVAGWSMWMHARAAAAEDSEEGAGTAAAATAEEAAPADKPAAHRERAAPPVYVPLEPFVVNLADRDTDRYAQVGITLEVDDPKFAEEMKAYLPSIRNAILLILSHKSAAEMLDRQGKEQLAAEIAREAVRPMGIDIVPAASGKPRKRRPAAVHNPVRQVHFSSFIVQ